MVPGDGIHATGNEHQGNRVLRMEGIRSKTRRAKHVDIVIVCVKYTDTPLFVYHVLVHVWNLWKGTQETNDGPCVWRREAGGRRAGDWELCAGVPPSPTAPSHPGACRQAGLAPLSVASLALPRLLSCRSKPTS